MSEWSDPDFEKIYNDNGAQEGFEGFVDIAKQLIHRQPSGKKFSEEDLAAIQQNFYNLMRYRCRRAENCLKWLNDSKDDLPVITNELLDETEPQWFAVAGMYGGFSYGLFERGGSPILIADSWVRIVGGSGEQHEITPEKVELVARGFV